MANSGALESLLNGVVTEWRERKGKEGCTCVVSISSICSNKENHKISITRFITFQSSFSPFPLPLTHSPGLLLYCLALY